MIEDEDNVREPLIPKNEIKNNKNNSEIYDVSETKRKRRKKKVEPSETEIVGLGFWGKLCCFFCCDKNKPTLEEMEQYTELNEDANELYEDNFEKGGKMFEQLEEKIKGCEGFQGKWKNIGFLTESPSKDLKAGGLFALEFMNYFVGKYKKKSESLFNDKQFPFALICIRLTYLARVMFYLIEKDLQKSVFRYEKIARCTRGQIKKFLKIQGYKKENFFSLVSLLLIKIRADFLKDPRRKENGYRIIEDVIKKVLEEVPRKLTISQNWKGLIKSFESDITKNNNSENNSFEMKVYK